MSLGSLEEDYTKFCATTWLSQKALRWDHIWLKSCLFFHWLLSSYFKGKKMLAESVNTYRFCELQLTNWGFQAINAMQFNSPGARRWLIKLHTVWRTFAGTLIILCVPCRFCLAWPESWKILSPYMFRPTHHLSSFPQPGQERSSVSMLKLHLFYKWLEKNPVHRTGGKTKQKPCKQLEIPIVICANHYGVLL